MVANSNAFFANICASLANLAMSSSVSMLCLFMTAPCAPLPSFYVLVVLNIYFYILNIFVDKYPYIYIYNTIEIYISFNIIINIILYKLLNNIIIV